MKQSNKFITGVLLGAMLFTNVSAVFAANSYTPQYNQGFNTGALQGKVVLVPTGTMIPAVASSNISSDTMDVGDSVSLALASPFSYNGTVLAPAGSTINGMVVMIKKSGRTGRNGQIKVKFTNIVTPTGQNIPISAKIATEDNSGILIGGTNKDRVKDIAKDTAIGTASGAVLGPAGGAIAGGKSGVGRGAWGGTAIGAGLGLGKSLWNKGNPVELAPGSPVNIVLEQQASINPY